MVKKTIYNFDNSNIRYFKFRVKALSLAIAEADFALAASLLHHDEPNGGALTPANITLERFGVAPRHYVRCTQDCAIPLSSQDHMIASDDAVMGGKTINHTLDSSHSLFLSQPAALATILVDIGSLG